MIKMAIKKTSENKNMRIRSMGTATHTLVIVIGLVIGVAVAVWGLATVYISGDKGLDFIWAFIFGKGYASIDIADTEIGQAILCAHWRCKEGCDKVESMSSAWTELTYLGQPGCPCEDSWDQDGDGRICGADESKNHPIKVVPSEETTISKGWYADNACDGGCNKVIFEKLADCIHGGRDTGDANIITFNRDSRVEIECTANNNQCTLPRETWYIWAYDNSLFYGQNKMTDVIICDNKPSEIASCEDECEARGYDDDTNKNGCEATVPSTPSCFGGNCVYYQDIGDVYNCDAGETCYCYDEEPCECHKNMECTDHGCEVVPEQSFVCCRHVAEGWTRWEGDEDCVSWGGSIIDGERCDGTTLSNYLACENYCDSRNYDESEYDDSTDICKCSEPGCALFSDRASCVAAPNCKWCDKCLNGVGPQTLSESLNWDECIPDTENCGYYDCVVGECCGAKCANSCGSDIHCEGEICNGLTCQCELGVCCYDPYNPTIKQCVAQELCGGIITSSTCAVTADCPEYEE